MYWESKAIDSTGREASCMMNEGMIKMIVDSYDEESLKEKEGQKKWRDQRGSNMFPREVMKPRNKGRREGWVNTLDINKLE